MTPDRPKRDSHCTPFPCPLELHGHTHVPYVFVTLCMLLRPDIRARHKLRYRHHKDACPTEPSLL